MSTVIVSLYQTATLKQLLGRPQRWRWRAIADNGEVLAVSSEAYTNRDDAVSAIEQLFGNQTTVHLRELDRGSRVLRVPTAARYRQLGNSVAVPVVEWIAHRIIAADREGRL